jgi:hypothetical protein
VRLEPAGEALECGGGDRLGPDGRDPPRAQVEAGRDGRGILRAEVVGERRRAAVGPADARHHLEPAARPAQERPRRHEAVRQPHVHRGQHEADEPEVVLMRQPGDHHRVVAVLARAHGVALELVHQRAVRDHHGARAAGRPRGVLEVGELARVRRRHGAVAGRRLGLLLLDPRARAQGVEHAHLVRRALEHPGGTEHRRRLHGRRGRGEALGADPRGEAARRRVDRHRQRTRVEAPEERRHEVEPRGVREHHGPPGRAALAQHGRDRRGARIQRPVGQRDVGALARLAQEDVARAIRLALRAPAEDLPEREVRQSAGHGAGRAALKRAPRSA